MDQNPTNTYRKVDEYLSKQNFGCFSDESSSCYSTATKSSRSLSPVSTLRRYEVSSRLGNKVQLPTDPLRFVTAPKSQSENLAHSAREQIITLEQQKKIRNDASASTDGEPEEEWQKDLDTWRKKRMKAIRSTHTVEGSSAERRDASHLTIKSPNPDDYADSGIENNRYNSTPNSPTSSTDYSPRSDHNTSGCGATSSSSLLSSSPPLARQNPNEKSPLDSRTLVSSRHKAETEIENLGKVVTGLTADKSSDEDSSSLVFYSTPVRSGSSTLPSKHSSTSLSSITGNFKPQVASRRTWSPECTATPVPYRANAITGTEKALKPEPTQRRTVYQRTVEHLETTLPSKLTMDDTRKYVTSYQHFRAVDIPLDEPKATEGQRAFISLRRLTLAIDLRRGEDAVRQGYGFGVTGGADRRAPITVETVIVDTPADRGGLQIGDVVMRINGEATEGRSFQVVRNMIAEAARLGEIELIVRRNEPPPKPQKKPQWKSELGLVPPVKPERELPPKQAQTPANSFEEFKRKLAANSTEAWSSQSLDRNRNQTVTGGHFVRRHVPTESSYKEYAYRTFGSPDYRVMSLDDRPDPGRLDDFVPEVERNGASKTATKSLSPISSSPTSPRAQDEPKLIRNYDLQSDDSTSSVGKGATDRRHSGNSSRSATSEASDKAPVDPKEWRQFVSQQRLPVPGHTESRNRIDADSRFRIIHRPVDRDGSTPRPLITAVSERSRSPYSEYSKTERSGHVFQEKIHAAEQEHLDEPVMTVSGRQRCAHCAQELGRGAAMIIESLNLFYHLSCFRCYVCNAPLGNGARGADVRVRGVKLHCQRCYSNDAMGLKYSRI